MKRVYVLFIFLLFTSCAFAQNVKVPLENGTILKCEATKTSGTINEYKTFTDYYEFINGKLYSQNLSKMFGNPSYKKKVLKLNITDNTITFKDRLYRWKASYYKWCTIDRRTGTYTFYAKRVRTGCGGYYQTARGTGYCTVVK